MWQALRSTAQLGLTVCGFPGNEICCRLRFMRHFFSFCLKKLLFVASFILTFAEQCQKDLQYFLGLRDYV